MNNTYRLILKIFSFLDQKRQNQFILVIFLSFFASFLEVATLGILVPFLKIILDGYILDSNNMIFLYIKEIFNISTVNEFIIFFFYSIYNSFIILWIF